MISTLAIGYLFLGGSGAGALCVLSIMELLRVCCKYSFGYLLASRELFARAWMTCLFCLTLGVAFLVFDLGNVDAVLYLLMSPQPVALTVGAFALPVSILLSMIFLSINMIEGVNASRNIIKIISVIGIVSSFITMGYTGVLLQEMASVVAWQTFLVPMLFVLSSISCGIALILGSVAFVETRLPLTNLIGGLLKIDSLFIFLEFIAIVAYIAFCFSDSRTISAVHALLNGDLSPLFWIGLVGVGLLLPFVMEHLITYSSHRHQLLFIAALVLVGGLMMRCCIVGLMQYDPSQELNYAAYMLQGMNLG